VLDLLPGEYSDPIECELRIVNIHDAPEYTALSYVWGTDSASQMIQVDGANRLITPNLELVLRHIRIPLRSTKAEMDAFYAKFPRQRTEGRRRAIICLWIDAICIDQGNMTEKIHQIKLMDYVFSIGRDSLFGLGRRLMTAAWLSGSLEH
jgi:hypothetical protein